MEKETLRNTGVTEVMAIMAIANPGFGRRMGSMAMPQESLQERASELQSVQGEH